MLSQRVGVAIVASFAFMLSGGATALDYMGEFCWELQSNTPEGSLFIPLPEPAPALLQLGVLRYGEGHFPVHGTITDTGRPPVVVQGNAERTPDIQVTLQGSSVESTIRQTLTYHILLDASLNGSYKLIGFEALGGGLAESLTDEGTLTHVPCP